jgi:nucleoside-diphosphate kinase
MIKPDGVYRRLVGKIVQRFEEKGLRIIGLKLVRIDRPTAENLYSVHKGKPFYESLVKFVTGGPVTVMVIEGFNAVDVCRKLMGATFAFNAEPGTIRGDYGTSKGYNLIHGSDSVDSFKREFPIFFKESELVSYEHPDNVWVYEEPERK